MQTKLDALDALLQRSDSDSMEWADGGGSEEAAAMLEELPKEEWRQLPYLFQKREAKWRACLACVLSPTHNEQATSLLIALASDQDAEVAFLAARGIAFYCGVNVSSQGQFIDEKVRSLPFVTQAKATPGLPNQIRKISSSCAPSFQRQFEQLLEVLES
jgi:hypothetical protein